MGRWIFGVEQALTTILARLRTMSISTGEIGARRPIPRETMRMRVCILPFCLFVYCLMAAGCDSQIEPKTKSAENADHDRFVDPPDAREILAGVRQTYRQAEAYTDDARLHLSYQLQGRFMEEPHCWSVTYQRPGRISAKLFNTRIQSDSNRSICFVYDFGSGNLDNQYLSHDIEDQRLDLSALFSDEIARHFLTGDSELPLGQTPSGPDTPLLPPVLTMLTGQLVPEWLRQPESVTLHESAQDASRWVLQIVHRGLNFVLEVDRHTNLISRIDYPVELLDPKLITHPQVQDLALTARFENAAWTTADDAEFGYELPQDGKQVMHFVAVPEPFPCGRIGKSLPPVQFRTVDGIYDTESWRGKVTLLHWISIDAMDSASLEVTEQLRGQFERAEYEFLNVFVVDEDFERNPALQSTFAEVSRKGQAVDRCADVGFANGQAIGMESFPCLLVIDRDGKLQYAASIEQDSISADELAQILFRVRSGDDVAAEMIQQYQQFLDQYHIQLKKAMQ